MRHKWNKSRQWAICVCGCRYDQYSMTRRYEQENGRITHYAGECPGPKKTTEVNIEHDDPDRYADCDDFGSWDDHTY